MKKKKDSGANAPSSNWVPLHRARFYDFPSRKMAEPLSQLIRTFGPEDCETDATENDVLVIYLRGVTLTIDGPAGSMSIGRDCRDDGAWWDADISAEIDAAPLKGSPEALLALLRRARFLPDYSEAASVLANMAEKIVEDMNERFQLSIDDGSARLYGRWRSVDAPLRPIEPDQWSHLSERHENGKSFLSADGVVVYSPHVAPHRVQHQTSAKAVRDCRNWLIPQLRTAVTNEERLYRPDLLELARQRWPSNVLSDRAFFDCLGKAKNDTKSGHCFSRGARPKLIHRTA